MTIEDEIRAAHERDLEELRRDIGTLRHDRERLENALRIAHEDIADLTEQIARRNRAEQ
jgi:hypothetical protein